MLARAELLEALSGVLPAKPGIAVIHSSFHSLLPPKGFEPWDALFAVGSLTQAGWTVALPAFTFSFCRTGIFDLRNSASETGVFAGWAMNLIPESIRTPHPIYSFVVLGPRAREIAACPSTTTFGDDSPFGFFERENARLVMLGCGWDACTQIHRYEEAAKVPYRYFKEFKGTADLGRGPEQKTAKMFVRDLGINPVNDFTVLASDLHEAGLVSSSRLFRGRVEATDAAALAAVATRALDADPYHYVRDGRHVAHAVAARIEAEAQPPLRLAVLGSFNLHRLEVAWRGQLAELIPERKAEFYSLPFGQMAREIIDPGSGLRSFQPHIRVFCDRLEDLGETPDAKMLTAAVDAYADLISRAHTEQGGWTIVHRLAALTPTRDSAEARASAVLVADLNAILDERLAKLDQVLWVDVACEAAAHPGPVLDRRLWYLGRFAFSEDFGRRLARTWTGFALATSGKTARLVVVDLDNTLWGGVLGEDGLAEIRVGGDYPGNAYADFQRALKALTDRGIALAVASKNDEDLALRALDELPSMVIRSADLSARRINWKPKWQSIQEVADELGLGLGSVLFVDDNPVERAQVRLNLPWVKILELPDDPAGYVSALADCPFLAAAAITKEDRMRVRSYNARQQLQVEASRAANTDEFFASLRMKLHLQRFDTGNAQRAAQLCQKTNQFNSTTRRYSLRELQQLQDEGADVIVVGLEDRYSQFENIGLLVLKPESDQVGLIDLYLLSCRVLGRGIETAIPRWAQRRAATRGWSIMRGEVIETERNTPVRSIFADAGFEPSGPGKWTASAEAAQDLPAWIELIDTVDARKDLP